MPFFGGFLFRVSRLKTTTSDGAKQAIYPTYVTMGSERMPLVEVPRTTPPFIVLENLAGQHRSTEPFDQFDTPKSIQK